MTIVVSDNSPLQYLVLIECIDILPTLYGNVLTTPHVIQELCQDQTPPAVRAWASSPRDWLTIESPRAVEFLDTIDLGEASALSLAKERDAGTILIDERAGTAIARQQGFRTVGTLGVLVAAGAMGLVDFESALTRLTRQTSFYASPGLLATARRIFHDSLQRHPGSR